jgi:PST family polysaccharide transporter
MRFRVPVSGKPLQNILWLVGERLARVAVTALTLGLVARHLAPEGFGRLNFAVATAALGAALAALGLDGLVVAELVRRPGHEGAVLGTAFCLRAVAGAVTAALLAGGAWTVPDFRPDAPLIGIVALGLLLQPADIVDLWFQRHLQSRRASVARLVAVAAGSALKLGLVAGGAPLIAFVWAQAADALFSAAALGWAYRRSPDRAPRWSWDAPIASALLRRSLPLAVSGVVVVIALRLDQFLVRAWCDPDQTGLYFAASRLTEQVLFAGTAVTLSFFPALSASHLQGGFPARLQSLFDLVSALGWTAALGFTGLGGWIVQALFGARFAGAGPVLAVQGWSCLFLLSAGVRWQFILLAAPTALNLAAAAVQIGVQIPAALWLMPRYGPVGAALASLVGAVASGWLTSFVFPPLRACAEAQTRGLLIPFAPSRWRAMRAAFDS